MTKPLDPIEATTASLPPIPSPHAGACQNCGTVLQGGYCHLCGQHAHNPLKSFRHAIEDVFESFWHLDGRVFRTVRDLLVPGRVVRGYLDGHRVRYIPPLRLYVVLSLITFFVAHFLTAGIQGGFDIKLNGNGFEQYKTVAAVSQERDRQLAKFDDALAELKREASNPGSQAAASGIRIAREQVARQAEARIAQLQGVAGHAAVAGDPALATTESRPPQVRVGGSRPLGAEDSLLRRLQAEWTDNATANAKLFAKDRRAFAERVIARVPTTLLVLVPLFALVLRIVYLLRPMGYLEHLVVSLYSHSFLLLAVLAWMLAVLLERALGSSLLSALVGAAFWIGAPLYLLFSQKRIYRDGWPLTLLRWLLIGFAYFFLATLAFAMAMAMSLVGKG